VSEIKHLIIGCGDVGRRIASQLIESGEDSGSILGLVNSQKSKVGSEKLGIRSAQIDLDESDLNSSGFEKSWSEQTVCYYLVPPQKQGITDLRTRLLLSFLRETTTPPEKLPNKPPKKVVLISTTGVYGDCKGEWVTEHSPTKPQTERGQRRLDSEHQWAEWATDHNVPLVILRVPGIYANSRIPRERIAKRIPVVNATECGYTNRIHADDLAHVAIAAMLADRQYEIYNATDGTPGKITEYLQAACEILGEDPLPEISMQQAREQLSAGMLSYLGESRRISNEKMLNDLKITLSYPNFKEGLKFG